MGWFEAVVLGVVQGLTEFLPISSSAHLRIVGEAFGWDDPGAAFTAITSTTSIDFELNCISPAARIALHSK